MTRKTCPRCKWNLLSAIRYATSRRDNETHICPECGTQEALEDSRLIPPFLEANPSRSPYWNTDSETWKAQEARSKAQ